MKHTKQDAEMIRRTVKDLKIFVIFIGFVVAGLLAAKYYLG
ncbi:MULTISPECIES: hypothetical protein [Brevibacillus]|jgi:hypothetical protein|nr:hypothetical protein [Brevibacillus borstelensis]MED1745496.1 hypothetical protein [Brevibacillus borstelensis]MED1854258.1 hypothetical protein [Brevibacillus borstelensis]MED1873315.1 hypothetical protein [Brevibacillus borstelensis]MED1885309.1 hypothetical protein [Brevibacillus borstelensis]MED2010170.1 hypothetical protein [Brevibacillus borstelensis]